MTPIYAALLEPVLEIAQHGAGGGCGVNWFGWAEREHFPPLGFALLNFVALILLLRKIAWPAIRGRARKRHEDVARRLDEAKKARGEAEARLGGYQRRLDAVDDEIASIVRGVREEAEGEKARLIAAALDAAARLRREADFTIQQDVKQLRVDLERELATRALVAAETLLRARLDEAADRTLQEEFLAGVTP